MVLIMYDNDHHHHPCSLFFAEYFKFPASTFVGIILLMYFVRAAMCNGESTQGLCIEILDIDGSYQFLSGISVFALKFNTSSVSNWCCVFRSLYE
jgi:hypothetical protein